MYDLTTILRDSFLDKACVRSIAIERHGKHIFIHAAVSAGSDQTPVHGTLRDIRRIRPDLLLDLFVEEV